MFVFTTLLPLENSSEFNSAFPLEKKYPKMTLNIREMQTHRIVEALENDELDVGLLATPLKISKIFERPLYYEPFSVLCKKGHPYSQLKKIKYTALKDDDIWLLEEGHCLRHQILDICSMKKNKTRKFNFESGSLETLKNLVESYPLEIIVTIYGNHLY